MNAVVILSSNIDCKKKTRISRKRYYLSSFFLTNRVSLIRLELYFPLLKLFLSFPMVRVAHSYTFICPASHTYSRSQSNSLDFIDGLQKFTLGEAREIGFLRSRDTPGEERTKVGWYFHFLLAVKSIRLLPSWYTIYAIGSKLEAGKSFFDGGLPVLHWKRYRWVTEHLRSLPFCLRIYAYIH